MNIRPAQACDAGEIRRVLPEDADVLTSIAFAGKRHWGYPEAWIRQWTEVLTLTPEFVATHPTYGAIAQGIVIGFYSLTVTSDGAELEHLWVLPAAMRRGVGRRLFQHAEATARRHGAARLFIISDPHAEGFYRRMGACWCGEQPASMDGTPRVLPILEKEL
ncbi:MAG TPA: GNAT family N-acetyltransferase [Opitutaceae bacterium]|nr:GNAT family N-acetyltransferase [Opitutaceae bacterium]